MEFRHHTLAPHRSAPAKPTVSRAVFKGTTGFTGLTGFSVVELLVVLAIAGFLLGLICAVYTGSFGLTARFQNECRSLQSFLGDIQQQCLSGNRHLYVGFTENSPPNQKDGGDMLLVAAFSRNDGLIGYHAQNPKVSWEKETLIPNTLSLYCPVQVYPTLKLAASIPPPLAGNMARPNVLRFQRVGHPSADSATPIPLKTGGQTIHFQRVIHFFPNGEARVIHQNTASILVPQVEIGVTPRASLPPPNPGDEESGQALFTGLQAAVQICGTTGRVRLFLP